MFYQSVIRLATAFALIGGTAAIAHAGPITGPNGEQVPQQNPGQEQADPGLDLVFESPPTTMFTGWPAGNTNPDRYIYGLGEDIDWIQDAYLEPAKFSPMCEFSVAMIVNSTGCTVMDIGWYNADDPSQVFTMIEGVGPPGYPVLNQETTASDFRADPRYSGGLIGFSIRRRPDYADCGEDLSSEYQNNAAAVIGALVYRSKTTPNAYYLAFDDSPSWAYSDLDYNDYLLKVTGVTCDGGNQPCQTGQPGICGPGLTECQTGGEIVCKQVIAATAEACDGLDNDCNGDVDDGDLCGADLICYQGSCVGRCGTGEFRCPGGLACDSDSGLCMEEACVGVSCTAGEVCRGGECVGACEGVVCPTGQVCQAGACFDPCAGVACDNNRVCENGVCVDNCNCRACGAGKACGSEGACVEAGCEAISCPTGQVCSAGACVDPCVGAVCPGGGACIDGACSAPQGMGGATGGSGGTIIIEGNGGSVSSGGSTSGQSDGGAEPVGRQVAAPSGCACRVAERRTTREGILAGAVLAGIAAARRRRRVRMMTPGA